eukprot:696565-Alexandrium_andersonii.AAC.1
MQMRVPPPRVTKFVICDWGSGIQACARRHIFARRDSDFHEHPKCKDRGHACFHPCAMGPRQARQGMTGRGRVRIDRPCQLGDCS